MLQTSLMPGFSDITRQSQRAFKTIMQAMAHPGRVLDATEPVAAPAPLSPVAAMVALTLCDYDTNLWIDETGPKREHMERFIAFHTGAPTVWEREDAHFGLFTHIDRLDDLEGFAIGVDTHPDRSTTLILQVASLSEQSGVTLSGPGIKTQRHFNAHPLPAHFWEMASANHDLFPRGVDFIFCAPTQIAALPRSTQIEWKV